MPTYEHLCKACEYEWEEVYRMTEDPPTVCPECGVEGQVKRLISLGPGPGIMRKTPGEIKAGIADETRAFKERARTDEKFRANHIGDDKYHERVLKQEALESELVKIGKKASKTRPKIKTSRGKKKQ